MHADPKFTATIGIEEVKEAIKEGMVLLDNLLDFKKVHALQGVASLTALATALQHCKAYNGTWKNAPIPVAKGLHKLMAMAGEIDLQYRGVSFLYTFADKSHQCPNLKAVVEKQGLGRLFSYEVSKELASVYEHPERLHMTENPDGSVTIELYYGK